jgi:golgin subfamily B member 1
VKCFGWAAALLGMRAPSLYIDPTLDRLIEMVPGVPPVSRLGKKALSGRDPEELAFVAGRHLSFYREEHFVRMLIPSIPDLEDLFLAALVIGNPGIPLGPDVKQRVLPISKAIEPILEPILVDRLRGYFLRFVEDGGRTNLLRWANAADRTSSRAGLLLSGSLSAAKAMLELEDSASAADRLDDLLVFQTSDRYANLRKQIGIALPTAG